MQYGIFIQSNRKQLLGAQIAKHALETRGRAREHSIPVSIILVEDIPAFQKFVGKPYRKNYAPYTFSDLQSFTLTRFMPPELMGFVGRALVIDPDIFALTDIMPLIAMDLRGSAVAACKKNPWDTSVMVLENAQLSHWKIESILNQISSGQRSYHDIAALRDERAPITELSRVWNSLDHLDQDTKMLHTTNRITQPWRTGLPVDFTFNPPPKLFGFIPRFWVQMPTNYLPHPDKKIEQIFIELLKEAIAAGAVTKEDIVRARDQHEVRGDILTLLDYI